MLFVNGYTNQFSNTIRALTHTNPPRDLNEATLAVDTEISTAIYAARAAVHNSMNKIHQDLWFSTATCSSTFPLLQIYIYYNKTGKF